MAQIDSNLKSISQVLIDSSEKFIIPDFQRSFLWTSEEANNLVDDFLEDTNNLETDIDSLPGYLLGNIVLISNIKEKQLDIIDGQQRLTTLTLLFKVLALEIDRLRNEHNEGNWYKVMGNMQDAFQFSSEEDDFSFKGLRIIHNDTLIFKDTYKKLITLTTEEEILSLLSNNSDDDENLLSVFNTLLDRVRNILDMNDGLRKFRKFVRYVRNKVMFIVTTVDSPGKAFQLFEILNNRGRSLEPLDLLKNSFLKTLYNSEQNPESNIKKFNDDWKKFTNILSSNKIQTSAFLKHFVLGVYGQNIKHANLFNFFQREKLTTDKILNLAVQLKNSAKIYASIIKNPEDNEFLESLDAYLLFHILKVKQMYALFIPFYEAPNDIKEKLMNTALKYSAAVLFSFNQTNKIESTLTSCLSEVIKQSTYNEKYETIRTILKSETDEYIKQLKENLLIRSFTKTKALQLLKFIELEFNQNHIITNKRQKISLEHILPQNAEPTDYGLKNEQQKAEYLNLIGNLTLLSKAANSSASDFTFAEKKDLYSESEFIITSSIVKKIETAIKSGNTRERINFQSKYQPQYESSELWTPALIEERSKNIGILLEQALTIN